MKEILILHHHYLIWWFAAGIISFLMTNLIPKLRHSFYEEIKSVFAIYRKHPTLQMFLGQSGLLTAQLITGPFSLWGAIDQWTDVFLNTTKRWILTVLYVLIVYLLNKA